jgi:hypothetical protein
MVKMVLELRHDCAGVSWMGMNIFAAATMAGCDDAAHAGNSAGRPNDGSLEPGINILIWIPAPPARCGIWTRMFVFFVGEQLRSVRVVAGRTFDIMRCASWPRGGQRTDS